jgi:hypothetical protein
LRVTGRILREDGSPVAETLVTLVDPAVTPGWSSALGRAESGPDGRFHIVGHVGHAPGALVLVAREGEKSDSLGSLRALGYIGGPAPPEECTATGSADADVARALADGDEVSLVLRSTFTIRGVVLDRDGTPADLRHGAMGGHRIKAVPAGSTHRFAWTAPSGTADVSYLENGAFVVGCVPAGAYDLWVTSEIRTFYTFSRDVHRFPAIPADVQDLELELPRMPDVRVRILTDASPELAQGMIVLHGRLDPRDPAALPDEQAPETLVVSSLAGWPEAAAWGFAGVSGDSAPEGRYQLGMYATEEITEHRLPPLGEGWYVFGVQPAHDRERHYVPMATRLLWFDAGDHTIDFRLTRSAALKGRVHAPGRGDVLALSVIDVRGDTVPVGVALDREKRPASAGPKERPTRIVTLPADGRFTLTDVPVGAVRLRVGARTRLLAGDWEREVAVEVSADENPPLEITL